MSARRSAAAFLLLVAAGPAVGQDEPAQLMRLLPTIVNTVGVVNVRGILNSPRARQEGWDQREGTEYLAGAVPVNPSIQRILVATEFVPGHPAHGGGLAIAPLTKPFDPAQFAAARGGKVVEVADQKAVEMPGGSWFVPLGDNRVGTMRTTLPQDVAKWVRFAENGGASLQSRYLNQVVTNFGTRNQIMLAVDTADLFPRDKARATVAASRVFGPDTKTQDAIERFVVALRGVRFTADVAAAGLDATLRFDASIPPDFPPTAFRAFLLETLDRNGAMLEDLQAADARADQNTLLLSFRVTDAELARIMGLVMPAASGVSESQVLRVAPGGVTMEASRRYFQAVNRILDDLRRQYDAPGNDSFPRTAVWHDTAAHRIETMSILNVDPAVIEYGQGTAARLHQIADSLRGAGQKVEELGQQGYYFVYRPSAGFFSPWGGFHWNYWGWGGGGVNTNLPQIQRQQEQAIQRDRENRDRAWSQINQQRAKVRADMAEKYMTDFAAPAR